MLGEIFQKFSVTRRVDYITQVYKTVSIQSSSVLEVAQALNLTWSAESPSFMEKVKRKMLTFRSVTLDLGFRKVSTHCREGFFNHLQVYVRINPRIERKKKNHENIFFLSPLFLFSSPFSGDRDKRKQWTVVSKAQGKDGRTQ